MGLPTFQRFAECLAPPISKVRELTKQGVTNTRSPDARLWARFTQVTSMRSQQSNQHTNIPVAFAKSLYSIQTFLLLNCISSG